MILVGSEASTFAGFYLGFATMVGLGTHQEEVEVAQTNAMDSTGLYSGSPHKAAPNAEPNSSYPLDPGERDAVAVVLGEATPLGREGEPTYEDEDRQNRGTGRTVVDPTAFLEEAIAFDSVIANRAADGRFGGSTWHAVINRREARSKA